MISYAQNFEDVILRRVFRNRTSGFYIDVGAMDPTFESVTKFFYDQGWCGINIEPNESFFKKIVSERERDINLNIALGDREEVRTFYASNETGLSTFDESNRDRLVQRGFEAKERPVQVTTLAAVCREHVDRPIDFLKVDCEGWEKQTLAGADWTQFRPTVVIVEATLPGIAVPAWSEWEPILIEDAKYDMVYFDGLNRFYLRRDSPGLRAHFSSPPNVFDGFTPHATVLAEQAGLSMTRERDSLAAGIAQLEQQLRGTVAELNSLTERLEQAARDSDRIAALERERHDLSQTLLKTRLWVGQLSQDLAAARRRRHS
jgi:FkbM family methyltransferase